MDDLQFGPRLVGSSPPARRAALDADRVCLATPQAVHDPLEAAFEEDLSNWLARLYAARTERVLLGRLERVYRLGSFAVILAVLAIPLFGVVTILTTVVLLVATMALAVTTASRSSDQPYGLPRPLGRQTLAQGDHPVFAPDERAQLVRVMNLSRAAWRPATRMLLRAEIREARSRGTLAKWEALYDLEDVVLDNAFASAVVRE